MLNLAEISRYYIKLLTDNNKSANETARSNTLSTPLQIPKINRPICSVVRDRNCEEVSKPSYQGV
jgi:hypothetical protein